MAAIDGQRKQTDELSVNQLIKTKLLDDSWIKSPAFTYGTPGDWAAAVRARGQYLLLQKEFPPTKVGNTNVINPQVLNFWATAANGQFALFYTKDGSRKSNMISLQRKAIEKDPMWGHVGKIVPPTDEVASAQ